MDNLTQSTNSNEKFFYKYQSLKIAVDDGGKVIKDDNGNDVIYTIQNLANNQLYFRSPSRFNDPLDSRAYCFYHGTEENFIDLVIRIKHCDSAQAKAYIQSELNSRNYEIHDGLIYVDMKNIYREAERKNLHGNIREAIYPKVCCFSGTEKSILMWSHYADSHQGICLRFRSIKDLRNKEKDEFYLEFDYLYPDEALQLVLDNPFHNLFYEIPFLEVEYKDDIPDPLNMFDKERNIKLHKLLLTKFSVWKYENEYRMILDEYDDETIISKEEFKKGLLKYQKEDLEGIVFGMKINYENAKLVYETIKDNYLKKGITVNFYAAKEVPSKYETKIYEINDIDTYLNSLQ